MKMDFASANPRSAFRSTPWIRALVQRIAFAGQVSDDIEASRGCLMPLPPEAWGHGARFSREELERMPMTVWGIEIEEMTGRRGRLVALF